MSSYSKNKCKEIIYVSANPYVNRYLPPDTFFKIIPVWKFGWDERLRTVPPEKVYEAALKAAKAPPKSIIIHFVQPHQPFSKLNNISDIWESLRKREITKEKAFWGYRENLKIVMPYVEKLCKILPGQTIITSDHGNAFGEPLPPLIPIKIYGHPTNVRIEPIVKIPWFICKHEGSTDRVERELLKLKIKNLKFSQKFLLSTERRKGF